MDEMCNFNVSIVRRNVQYQYSFLATALQNYLLAAYDLR